PLLESRTGCPTPRQPPTNGFNSARASCIAARDSFEAGSDFASARGLLSASAATATTTNRPPDNKSFWEAYMSAPCIQQAIKDILTDILAIIDARRKAKRLELRGSLDSGCSESDTVRRTAGHQLLRALEAGCPNRECTG